MTRSAGGRFVGLLGFVLVAAAPAGATSYVPVSDEHLVGQAGLIARVRILSEQDASGGNAPSTEYLAEVRQVLKGEDPGSRIVVRVPGGATRRRSMRLHVYGAPRFRPGGEALLFLKLRSDGSYSPLHLMLGAFHEVRAGGGRLAVRHLGEARALTLSGAPARPEPVRNAGRFAAWIAARAAGSEVPPDYAVRATPDALSAITEEFTLFEDGDTGKNLRWFEFDGGGSVTFRAHSAGQAGLGGGGFNEFQQGLQAWNSESQTPIKYLYGGTTAANGALGEDDGINAIVFSDLRNDIEEDFSCTDGGILAIGGPWYEAEANGNFNGKLYHRIVEADVVINSGINCFFADSPNASKGAAELYGHELGHTLGIDHACDDADSPPCSSNPTLAEALMAAFIHDDGRGPRLNSDDNAAARTLYKPTGPNPGAKPAAPSAAGAQVLSFTAALFTFKDNAGNETDFVVEVSVDGGPFAQTVLGEATVVPGNGAAKPTVEVVLNDLNPGAVYVFRVKARNGNGSSAYATAPVIDLPSSTSCIESATSMCLLGRFLGRLEFRSSASAPFSLGQVSSLETAQSGLFFFANPDNLEMLVKMVNACGTAEPRYWVFLSATTNVEFVLTVTDTQSGFVRRYKNPLNNPAAPVQDTDAFATCP